MEIQRTTSGRLASAIGASILALALVLSFAPGAIAAGSGDAGAGSQAVAAKKKKCKKKKKKGKKGAVAAKKCGKNSAAYVDSVQLSWCGGSTDMDLHVYSSDGGHAGWNNAVGGVENTIPGGLHAGDHPGANCTTGGTGGLERYTDSAPTSHQLAAAACYAVDNSGASIHPSPSYVVDVHFTNGVTLKFATAAFGWGPDVLKAPILDGPGQCWAVGS